ncbi:MAG: 4Fe-4S dicluster domain-containing protein [Candidatus Bathyarchaeia archaeon]
MSASFKKRKFVSADPSKCTGCGVCELACSQEKMEGSPLRSRIRVVRLSPVFNFALACRACEDAKCKKVCPEKAIEQDESSGLLLIDEKKCKGCDWCVQACPYGCISIQSNTGVATVCDLCGGTPQCVEFCPEEALELIDSDEAAAKRFNGSVEELSKEFKRLATLIDQKDLTPLVANAERIYEKLSAKLVALDEKAGREKEEDSKKNPTKPKA